MPPFSPAPDQARAPRWRATELLGWLGLMAIWTVAWSWGSVFVAEHFSPAIVFPILSGLVFGGGAVVAMRLTGLASRRWLIGGTLVGALLLVGGHHFVGYRLDRIETERRRERVDDKYALFFEPETSFERFLQTEAQQGRPWFGRTLRGPWVWASWIGDGLLELLAAVGLVTFSAGEPYCARCRTWYRTVRSGKVDAARALALAEACGCGAPGAAAEYRILQCQAGCGPARLDLAASGSGQTTVHCWLDREQQERVRSILDAGSHPSAPAPGETS